MISMYFGSPGAGKTCLARRILYVDGIKYEHCFANFDTPLAMKLDPLSFANFNPPINSLIVIDEAGICFNNRQYKSLDRGLIEFFKKHRHLECDIVLVSQSWEDVDVTLRRLTDKLYYIRKLGLWTLIHDINKRCIIDKDTHQIVDGYYKTRFFFRWFFRPFWYDRKNKYDPPLKPVIFGADGAKGLTPKSILSKAYRFTQRNFIILTGILSLLAYALLR